MSIGCARNWTGAAPKRRPRRKAGQKQRYAYAYAYDRDMYRWRHPVENRFAKIEEFRGIATRYNKNRYKLPDKPELRRNLHPIAIIVNGP